MPKPPPTSPTSTRTSSGFNSSASHTLVRTPEGIWLDMRIVRRWPSKSASTVRGSIGDGATRWFTMSTATRTAARANAASVAAASPWRATAATLSAKPSTTLGAPGCSAATASVTAGSSS